MITIDTSKCVGCGACAEVCPTQAIYLAGKKVYVREGYCRACGACVEACPKSAITMMNPALNPFGKKSGVQHPSGISFDTGFFRKRVGRHRHGRWRR